jgi:hypothetical protein
MTGRVYNDIGKKIDFGACSDMSDRIGQIGKNIKIRGSQRVNINYRLRSFNRIGKIKVA